MSSVLSARVFPGLLAYSSQRSWSTLVASFQRLFRGRPYLRDSAHPPRRGKLLSCSSSEAGRTHYYSQVQP